MTVGLWHGIDQKVSPYVIRKLFNFKYQSYNHLPTRPHVIIPLFLRFPSAIVMQARSKEHSLLRFCYALLVLIFIYDYNNLFQLKRYKLMTYLTI